MKRSFRKKPGYLPLFSLLLTVGIVLIALFLKLTGSEPEIPRQENISQLIEDSIFTTVQEGIKSLSESGAVIDLLSERTLPDNDEILNTLDTARRIFNASIVYALDNEGTVKACTPYGNGLTLTGNNYSFRPFIQSALRGESAVYPALGVTTRTRGLYFSYPVLSGNKEDIIGVMTVKLGMENIDRIINEFEEPVLLITPNKVVFSSNQENFLYRHAYPLSDEQKKGILESKQFSDQPIDPLPFFLTGSKIGYEGYKYKVHRYPFLFSRWEIAVLQKGIRKYVFDRNTVILVLGFILFLILLVFVLVWSISVLKKTEAALRKSRETYHSLFSLAPDGICISKTDGTILSCNEAFSDIFKYPPDRIMTMNTIDFFRNPEERKYLLKQLMEQKKIRQYALNMRDADNKSIRAVNSLALIDYKGEECIETIIKDLTEIYEKEQLLQQAQKMELLGTLSGGLAHDFNNMMGGITGHLSLMKYNLENNPDVSREELTDNIRQIEHSISHSANLIHQLLSFSRKQEFKPVRIDLNEILKEIAGLCRSTFDMSIELILKYSTSPAVTIGDPTRIEQAVLNLCINASHAMTTMRRDDRYGGKLTLSLTRGPVDRTFLMQKDEIRDQEFWILTVQDTGIGIDRNNIEEIFKPFYTTKGDKDGTGLGLIMVRNIMEQHKGLIDVDSVPGEGTTFYLYFPLVPDRHGETDSESS